MNAGEWLREASGRIVRRDAEMLLARALDRDRTWLMTHPEAAVSESQAAAFGEDVRRREAGEPLQYILGEQEFYGLSFRVTPDVLIPRPETEHLVEAVLLWATRFHDERMLHIADVGTGSGAIAVALATHLAGARFVATDISEAALEMARQNARAHGCENRIEFVHADLLEGVGFDEEGKPQLDAIASNPPYVPTGEREGMQREVVEHEPHTALFAGEDGLSVYRRLIPAAHAVLRPGGLIALEIGHGQRDAVAGLLAGWKNVRFVDDLQGIPRVALADKPA